MRIHPFPVVTVLLASALIASPQALAQDAAADPVYIAGRDYTAAFSQRDGRWRLLPADGQDVEISPLACPASAPIPTGIWLLTRDAQGRPELLAPSATALPPGGSERVALRPCDQADAGAGLAVPQAVIDLLAANTGSIYVGE